MGILVLTDVECGQLQVIGAGTFQYCTSLRSLILSSVRVVEEGAFGACYALTDVKFSTTLERFEEHPFWNCSSLERITIPLKDGIITADDTFQGCEKLKHVDLVEGELHHTITFLQLEAWKNDMYEEIYSIHQTLPNADAGDYGFDEDDDVDGEKAQAIRLWIRSVLGKIIYYKAEHHRLLDEDVAPTIQQFLPQDIVMNSILPFLELPSNSTSRVIST